MRGKPILAGQLPEEEGNEAAAKGGAEVVHGGLRLFAAMRLAGWDYAFGAVLQRQAETQGMSRRTVNCLQVPACAGTISI
jgi:hypothetical protein